MQAEFDPSLIDADMIDAKPSAEGRLAFEKCFRQGETGLLRKLARKANALLTASS